MLNRIDLKHFKCFEELSLPLAKLTLLSGTNASGKSSILQALVLLHQTMREHEWSRRLMLNGASIRLGTVLDVVDKVNGRRGFELGLSDDEVEHQWEFEGERTDMSVALTQVQVSSREHIQDGLFQNLYLRYLLPIGTDGKTPPLAEKLRNLTYITAERIGPRETYPLLDPNVGTVVGPNGEHAVSLLHLNGEMRVHEALVLEGEPPTLLGQVGQRMRQFFPGSSLVVERVPQANVLTLGLRTSDDTDFHRPVHVGFGLTQVLPIIVAVLSAKPNDLILIENPEVHLHPSGQVKMGQFLAEVAATGVQVIIETHSDHVLNGVRRGVKSGLPAEDVAIHFFQPRHGDGAQVMTPQLDANGNIDVWPEGFFDQFDKDMNYFAGWGE